MSYPWVGGRVTGESAVSVLASDACFSPRRLIAALALACSGMLVGGGASGPAQAAGPLPVPCSAGACGAGPSAWVTSGAATSSLNGTRLNIHQQTDKAILNWKSFDIDPGHTVKFDQPNAASIALNRIFQNDPSLIRGALKANGQIYLINQNGILFGKGSKVDVHTLVASTLKIEDQVFEKGILSALQRSNGTDKIPAFAGDSGEIKIEGGAEIRSAKGGRLMILSPKITNEGSLESPDGQIILAAGNKIYLQGGGDTLPRGLLVEVDVDSVGDAELERALKGEIDPATGKPYELSAGAVSNLGKLLAERGNVTMIGLAVNQGGRASATTAVSANGSIRLLARDNNALTVKNSERTLDATRTGSVVFGEGSLTDVTLDQNGETAVEEQVQERSVVKAVGSTIAMQAGSAIVAPSGEVTLQAVKDPSQSDRPKPSAIARNDSRIHLAAGSRIDVSGASVDLDMTRNQVEVELRGNELRDAPLQRDGALRGKAVTVDIRKGTPLADVSGAVANVRRDVAERSTTGGNVTLASEGDTVVLAGASIDVSGGQVNYRDGYLTTSKLVSDRHIVDISTADPDRVYTKVLSNRQFEEGYTDGQDAGTLTVIGNGIVLDGDLAARTTSGRLQRAQGKRPLPGKLLIGDLTPRSIPGGPDFRIPDVFIARAVEPLTIGLHDPLPEDLALQLRAGVTGSDGFGRLGVYSNGSIRVQDGLDLSLPDAGELTLVGHRIELGGVGGRGPRVTTHGGEVTLRSAGTFVHPDNDPGGIFIADGTRIDTGGRWINDNPLLFPGTPTAPAVIDGGAVSITMNKQGRYSLGDNLSIETSGGAWLQADGTLQSGKGGDISLGTVRLASSDQMADIDIGKALQLRSYSLAQGGKLSLNFNRVVVSGDDSAASRAQQQAMWSGGQQFTRDSALQLPATVLQQGGFSQYEITANDGDLSLSDGTRLSPRMHNRVLDTGFQTRKTGSKLDAFSHLELLPVAVRKPTDVTLAVTQKRLAATDPLPELRIADTAAIRADARATVGLTSTGRLLVDGSVDAPGGVLDLRLTSLGQYDTTRVLHLGAGSLLSARGTTLLQPNDRGLRIGEVLPGGSITLRAEGAFVIAEPGSRMDVAGSSSPLDLGLAYGEARRSRVDSDAGSIRVSASEGLRLGGTLEAQGGGPASAGGLLSVALRATDRGSVGLFEGYSDQTTRRLLVSQQPDATLSGIDAAGFEGDGLLAADRLAGSGVDRLELMAPSNPDRNEPTRIEFVGDVSLDLRHSLTLDAPLITASPAEPGRIRLNAAYLQLGQTTQGVLSSAEALQPAGGESRLDIQAGRLIELAGASALQGFHQVTLASGGDLRLRGELSLSGAPSTHLPGALAAAGALTLQAEQIYPTTLTAFTLSAADVINGAGAVVSPGSIRILPGDGASPAAPLLSAGGSLTLEATTLDQQGVLKAPLGSIKLNGRERLGLAAGSLTTTSADDQLIPLGTTLNGSEWRYDLGDNANFVTLYKNGESQLPGQNLQLRGATVEVADGATLDLSGGGDLYAYEFVSGPGGSVDALSAEAAQQAGRFALLPKLGVDSVAPFDTQESTPWNLSPGDSVYLSAAPGLKAGEYALLPARYALLPGALLVTAVDGYRDLPLGRQAVLPNGATVVSGYFTTAGTGIRDSGNTGFTVQPGDYARQLAEYRDTFANEFFPRRAARDETRVPRLPRDAGNLLVAATASINLDGRLQAAAAAQGRGAQVDIVAADLRVVAARDDSAGGVQLLAADLNQLGAESLLLGAERSSSVDGTRLTIGARTLRVETGATLSAPDLLLAAQEDLRIQSGARLEGRGTTSAPADPLLVSGDSALLRVSAAAAAELQRSDVQSLQGTLSVEDGAVLSADNAILLDATLDTRSQGTLELAQGALSLGSSRISVGNTGTVDQGLVLSSEDLARLSSLDQLTLRSLSSIDLYGGVDLTAGALDLQSAGLVSHLQNGETARLTANDRLTISNPGKASAPSTPGTGGELQLGAQQLVVGPGTSTLQGFDRATLDAGGEIKGSGSGGLKVTAAAAGGGHLTLNSPRLVGEAGADTTFTSAGDVRITAPGEVPADAPAPALGAKLTVSGNSIAHQGRILLPSGSVTLHSKGAGGNVQLTDGALIDVAGTTSQFDDLQVGTPGGDIHLLADRGDLKLDAGSRLDVSGGSAGGDAGSLSLSAPQGQITLEGEMAAAAQSSFNGGSFQLDAGALAAGTTFSALNQALNAAQFTFARDLRLRTGEVTLGAGETALARSFRLAVDSGGIDMAGAIDASGQSGGHVALNARDDIYLRGTASIDASAQGDGEAGGLVEISTRQGALHLQASSSGSGINVGGTRQEQVIDAAGKPVFVPLLDDQGQPVLDSSGAARITPLTTTDTGRVVLRAPRSATGLALDPLKAPDGSGLSIRGAQRIEALAYRSYADNDGLIGAAERVQYDADAKTFMNNAGPVLSALGMSNDDRFHLRPGIEVQYNGALQTDGDWDLLNWRYWKGRGLNEAATQLEPGELTLRAGEGITLAHNISDAFIGDELQTGYSWNYRLVAGADPDSADPLATVGPGQGHELRLAPGVKVRTGTGSVEMRAADDLVLADADAAVYTAGVAARDTGVGYASAPVIWGTGGGAVSLKAGNDLVGADGNQLISEWLHRQGGFGGFGFFAAASTQWAVSLADFRQNIGAFGGGNVTLEARRDILNLSAMVPTTGKQLSADQSDVGSWGGGDLDLRAGRDVVGGVYYVARGAGTVRAGGAIDVDGREPSANEIGTLLAVADGQFDLRARKNVRLDAVVNPTALPQSSAAATPTQSSSFYSYSPSSAVAITSMAGNILLQPRAPDGRATPTMKDTINEKRSFLLYPASLKARALQGDISIPNELVLFPSRQGDLELLAHDNIKLSEFSGKLTLSDSDPDLLPVATAPSAGISDEVQLRLEDGHAAVPLHRGDPEAVRIAAQVGDISGGALELPKFARFSAGRDITNIRLSVQNLDSNDITLVQAGRDLRLGIDQNTAQNLIEASGPGQLQVIAGRDVELGQSAGITTIGATKNPALPAEGAAVTVMAGAAQPADYAGFVDAYFNHDNLGSRFVAEMRKLSNDSGLDEAAALARYTQLEPAQRESLMDTLGLSGGYAKFFADYLPAVEDRATFRALPVERQRKLVQSVLFAELRDTGREATASGGNDFSRGLNAIHTLFPEERDYAGDLSMFLSRIYTIAGGDIDLLVPGGRVNAGAAVAAEDLGVSKKPSELGIVTQAAGDVSAFSDGDFLVNQSRVFTLRGGNILMWSSNGNIDAGRGAKSSISAPEPTVSIDAAGNVQVNFAAAIAGSGIRAIVTSDEVLPGDVDLIAPSGEVNAGDAGIGSAGNLNIAAVRVVGAENIQVGGISTGVPVDTGGLGAGLAGISNIAGDTARVADQATQSLGEAATDATLEKDFALLTVEVLGFGECDQRQGDCADK